MLCEEFWSEHRATFFDPLFGAYTSWFEKNILPRFTSHSSVRYHCSHFPGDLSVFLDLPDRPPVTVVGLNSAWVHYTNGDFDRRIELFTQQLHYALGDGAAGPPLDDLAGRSNLLLMHHPPAWLSAKASQRFKEEI
jgi:hypothetical protein